MSREIKFRAWNQRHEEMTKKSFTLRDIFESPYSQVNDHIDTIFMQYAGLKDKNGVEIYEGDIVRGDRWDKPVGAIVYKEHYSADINGEYVYDVCGFVYTNEELHDEWINSCEVIGNIYENKELLDESNS